eukprot:10349001-Lingulodinium_polyedra.AAC.1
MRRVLKERLATPWPCRRASNSRCTWIGSRIPMYRVGVPGKPGPIVTMLLGSLALTMYTAMPAIARSYSA